MLAQEIKTGVFMVGFCRKIQEINLFVHIARANGTFLNI